MMSNYICCQSPGVRCIQQGKKTQKNPNPKNPPKNNKKPPTHSVRWEEVNKQFIMKLAILVG